MKLKPSCIVSCPIDTFSGYGARARDFVKALIQSKNEEWDIKIMPQRWGDTPWGFLSQDDPLKSRFIGQINNRPDIWIQITVPNEFQKVGHFSIGITAGIETTAFPGSFIEGMNRMDLNLVSSKHSKEVAIATRYDKINKQTNQNIGVIKLEKPCEVLFEGLDLNTYFKNPAKSGLLEDIEEDFCFLFTGHWLPGEFGEDRKNVATLVKTFYQTFKDIKSKNKPALVLKTNKGDYSLMDKELIINDINKIRQVSDFENKGVLPNVYLLHGEMTNEELNLLNNDPKIKSFVSFTKGEGFGRPLLEQAITGKPVITTNWSVNIDFIKPGYNILIGGTLKPIHRTASNEFLLKDAIRNASF